MPAATSPAKRPPALTRRSQRERHPLAPALGLDDEALPAVTDRARRAEAGRERHRPACVLELALVGEHQRMAVDDPGRGREEPGDPRERRLHRPELRRPEGPEVVDPVRRCRGRDPGELPLLLGRGRDDDLADPTVGHPAALAVGIEHLPAANAEPRLRRALRDSRCRRGSPRCCASWYGCRSAAPPRARSPRARRGRGRAPPRARPPRPRPPRTRPGPSHASLPRRLSAAVSRMRQTAMRVAPRPSTSCCAALNPPGRNAFRPGDPGLGSDPREPPEAA